MSKLNSEALLSEQEYHCPPCELRCDVAADVKHVTGEFTFSREEGLSLVIHSLEHDFDLTAQCVAALKSEAIRLLREQCRCPFYYNRDTDEQPAAANE